jgi:hypothetical protein
MNHHAVGSVMLDLRKPTVPHRGYGYGVPPPGEAAGQQRRPAVAASDERREVVAGYQEPLAG